MKNQHKFQQVLANIFITANEFPWFVSMLHIQILFLSINTMYLFAYINSVLDSVMKIQSRRLCQQNPTSSEQNFNWEMFMHNFI